MLDRTLSLRLAILMFLMLNLAVEIGSLHVRLPLILLHLIQLDFHVEEFVELGNFGPRCIFSISLLFQRRVQTLRLR